VANSARSQIAEAVARATWPADVQVGSAGTEPSQVNPLAVAALQEAGFSAEGHWSKGVSDVPDVDVVVTLCAEERCPAVLSDARRIHHPLADPHTAADFAQVVRTLADWLPGLLHDLRHSDD